VLRYEVPEDVEEQWERIKTKLQEICENTLRLEKNKKKEWLSDSTWKMIERRNQMKGKSCAVCARTRKRKELEKQYAAFSKGVNKSVRRNYRAYVDSIGNEAQVAANQGNIKGMFTSIRRLTNNVWLTTVPIRDKGR
jgi:regulator of replication initiation timing